MTTPYRTSEMPVAQIPPSPFMYRLANVLLKISLPAWVFRVAALLGGILGIGMSHDAYAYSVIPYAGITLSLGIISGIIALGGVGQLIDKGFR